MKKPEPPKPRIIREDFLPEDDVLKNYRVLKYQYENGEIIYYPQHKFLGLFWVCIDAHREFKSLEWAIYFIKQDIITKRKPTVEYIELTEKDLELPPRDPNPPLLEP
jgi:hypothetical protein